MTTTTEPIMIRKTRNPHRMAAKLLFWSVPIVFVGAMWGAGHDPAHAEWSAFALTTIVVLYAIKSVQAAVFDRRHGAGK